MSRIGSVTAKNYKLKSNAIANLSDYNQRKKDVEHTFPERKYLNRELVDERNGLDFDTYVKHRIEDLQEAGAITRKFSSRSVGSIEVLIRANGVPLDANGMPPEDFDLDDWARDTVEWMKERYNPENGEIHYKDAFGDEVTEKTQNVYSAILHMDESSPHIHFMVIPIDRNGHMTTADYSKSAFVKSLQTDYFKAVGSSYGLEKGVEGSPAKSTDIRQYHTYINQIMAQKHPEHIDGESPEEYDLRVDEVIQSCHSHMRKQDLDHEKELNGRDAVHNNYCKNTYREHRAVNEALGLGRSKDFDLERVREIGSNSRTYESIMKAADRHPDKELSENFHNCLSQLLLWEQELDEQEKEKEKQ